MPTQLSAKSRPVKPPADNFVGNVASAAVTGGNSRRSATVVVADLPSSFAVLSGDTSGVCLFSVLAAVAASAGVSAADPRGDGCARSSLDGAIASPLCVVAASRSGCFGGATVDRTEDVAGGALSMESGLGVDTALAAWPFAVGHSVADGFPHAVEVAVAAAALVLSVAFLFWVSFGTSVQWIAAVVVRGQAAVVVTLRSGGCDAVSCLLVVTVRMGWSTQAGEKSEILLRLLYPLSFPTLATPLLLLRRHVRGRQ